MSELFEKLAYLNGRLIPASHLSIPPTDAGFVLGVTVAEQMRTFGGELFRWEEHLRRFQQSLRIVGTTIDVEWDELKLAAERLVRSNRRYLGAGDDLGLSLFATPGTYGTFAAPDASRIPMLAMHTYPLPFYLWAHKYEGGEALRTTSVQQVPPSCWPTELKCRSRMHYYLAEREAAAVEPDARAVMLDQEGFVTETSTANLVLCRDEKTLVSPPREKILPGISVSTLAELAGEAGYRWEHEDLRPHDLLQASEIILTSTSVCLLPVTRFEGQPVGTGRPGPIHQRLLKSWSDRVGTDIAAQARQFAARPSP